MSFQPIATANIMTQATTSVKSVDPVTQLSQSGVMNIISCTSQSAAVSPPGMMSQSAVGSYPGMMTQSTGSYPVLSHSTTNGLPGMTQSTGSYPVLSQSTTGFPSMMPQSAGNLPDLLGVQGIPNPRLMNPVLMNQAGLPCTGMGDFTNTMFPATIGYQPGMNQNFHQGSLPQFNPLMIPRQNIGYPNLTGMVRAPLMPNMGRGQALTSGILPGLLPLVQNLNLGRGSGS